MPIGSTVVAMQLQDGIPTIWFTCNPDEFKREGRTFIVTGTGISIEDTPSRKYVYIGTFQMFDGVFIGHVFEVVKI